jgi:hypothetical protein
MSYYYMFSKGSYSDYCVGGLYKSKQELDETYFIEYVRSMLLSKIDFEWKEAVDFITNWEVQDIGTITNQRLVTTRLFELHAGKCPLWNDKEGRNLWNDTYCKWLSEQTIELNYIEKLVEEGILVKVEYQEIWEG